MALNAYDDRQWQLALVLFSVMDGASVDVGSISHNAAINAQRSDEWQLAFDLHSGRAQASAANLHILHCRVSGGP
jgi:hypothetical protein